MTKLCRFLFHFCRAGSPSVYSHRYPRVVEISYMALKNVRIFHVTVDEDPYIFLTPEDLSFPFCAVVCLFISFCRAMDQSHFLIIKSTSGNT